MNFLLTGATGLIGRALARRLLLRGHAVAALTRDPERARGLLPAQVALHLWPEAEPPPAGALTGAEAVVHLAGEPIAAKRWSEAQKRRIRDSRVHGTTRLVEALAALGSAGPRVVISASAIGYYGDRGDAELAEDAAGGSDFLARLCLDWEQALFAVPDLAARRVAVRTGIVLDPAGGALAKLLPVFRAGLGGPVGGGRQWMSWIHLDDLVGLLLHAAEHEGVRGPINAVAPHPVRNGEFGRMLGAVLRRPAGLPVPGFILRIGLGEMATLVLSGQRVVPRAALETGFHFRFPKLRAALQHLCGTGAA